MIILKTLFENLKRRRLQGPEGIGIGKIAFLTKQVSNSLAVIFEQQQKLNPQGV